MSEISFDFEWLDPGGAQAEELRATWASLTIRVADLPLTGMLDLRNRSYRTHVFLPLFPLAEWIANNWWFVSEEVGKPETVATTEFDRRHNIRWAREGFALPSLRFVSVGEQIELQWQPLDVHDAGVRFINVGQTSVAAGKVLAALSQFVEAVVTRLDDHGIHETSLHAEWKAIQEADHAERRFCAAAGRLGVDPYALDDDVTDAILACEGQIIPELLADFLSLASLDELAKQAESLANATRAISDDRDDLDALSPVRNLAPTLRQNVNPWQTGYEYARELRRGLNANGWKSRSLDELAAHLGIVELDRCLLPATGNCRFLDALAGENQQHKPKFLIEKRHESSRQFAFCRAMFEHLTRPTGSFALVSGLRTDRQKMNRAFAAEFLVPHDQLAADISAAAIGDEEISDLADAYGVSEMVIRHQVENHQLADLVT